MAWRIHDSVIRGEVDNRTKGVVRGRIWLEGWAAPMELDLQGNAHADLAGCLLTFTNPLPRIKHPHLDGLKAEQHGTVGDITASRKVRVMEISMPEAYLMKKRGEFVPEHMANCLYLEWFSEANGRVVIESADYELTVSAPEWRLTPEEDSQRAEDAAAGFAGFMGKLGAAIEEQQKGQKDPETEEWDEHDFEKFMKESDARTDKYMELLDKYGDSDEAEERIAREMGWDREFTPEEAAERREWIEEMNAAAESALDEPEPEPDPTREGIDWIRTEDGDIVHPLQHRCFESAMKVWHAVKALGEGKFSDPDVVQFVSEFQITSAKLAGALNGIAEDRRTAESGFTVACLKRALDHLHKSQAGLETVAQRNILPSDLVVGSRAELFAIREGVLRLMDEFRGRGNGETE